MAKLEVDRKQKQQAMSPPVEMIRLPQKRSWLTGPNKLPLGMSRVTFHVGLPMAWKMGQMIVQVKFMNSSMPSLQQAVSMIISREAGIFRNEMNSQYRMIQMMLAVVALLSLTIWSTSIMFTIAKVAPQLASESLMPMPTSACLMAMRSLAPSPHMPTLDLSSPHVRDSNDLTLNSQSNVCLNLVTTRALFSGEILANSFMLLVRTGGGSNVRKSLSIAIGQGWLRQLQSQVSSMGYSMVVAACRVRRIPLNFLGNPCWNVYLGCFLPSSSTTLSCAEMTPALTPVSTAMNMLSPVIILGSMPPSTSRSMVCLVSCLSLFSNATNDKAVIPCSNTSRGSSKYFLTQPQGTTRQPHPIVLQPPRDNPDTTLSQPWTFKTEFFSIFSGAPLMKAQILLSIRSLTSTDIDWNLDSN